MNMSMNGRKMLNIFAILGTSSLILGNIALPSYAFLKQTSQSQVNTDPGIDKQVLKGVALILKGVDTILMGKTSRGLDEVSTGANMIRASCNITNGENGANGSSGNGAKQGLKRWYYKDFLTSSAFHTRFARLKEYALFE
jgi:hypothetical protein